MAVTFYNPNGGPIKILPIMEGPMNCGYRIDAYKTGSDTSFLSIKGDIEHSHPLIFDPLSMMGENTRIFVSFSFRAGNDTLVGAKYRLGIEAYQDGQRLSANDESDPDSRLPKEIEREQYVLRMKAQQMAQNS